MPLNPELRTQVPNPWQRPLSPQEQEMVLLVRRITPKAFLRGIDEGFGMDYRLLGMVGLALLQFNSTPPITGFSLRNGSIPFIYQDLIAWGAQCQIMAFMMAKYTLIDISYSDSGFSISVDRVSKLNTAHEVQTKQWMEAVEGQKNEIMLRSGAVLGTPRFQSNLARMIGMLSDGAYGWGIP